MSINDDAAYDELRAGCDAGQLELDRRRPAAPGAYGYGFSGPRFAVLMAAGIAACRGDLATARFWADHAVAEYGLDGLAIPEIESDIPGDQSCLLYREIFSVLDQRPPEEFVCPAGEFPRWRTDASQHYYDDPLTPDVDESIPPDQGEPDSGTGTIDGGGTDGTDGTDTDGTDPGTGTDGNTDGTDPGTDGGASTPPPEGGSE